MGGEMLCLAYEAEPSEEDLQALKKAFRKMMKTAYRTSGGSFTVKFMEERGVRDFVDTHAGILNGALEQTEMSNAMKESLHRSNWIFSGFKAMHELGESIPQMLDGEGRLKTFEHFLNDVQKVDETYNRNYLRAEYNFAHTAGEMAGRWEAAAEDGDRYDLQYRTVNDGKVREEHARLHNVVQPVDSKFWDEYYPPNGWNCRCTVVQVRKGKYPTISEAEAVELGQGATDSKGMFRFNPGKEKAVWPGYNPYTISMCRTCGKGTMTLGKVPANQLCSFCGEMRREMVEWKAVSEMDIKEAKIEVKQWFADNPDKTVVTDPALQTGKLRINSQGRKNFLSHAMSPEAKWLLTKIAEYPEALRFVSSSPLGEGKDLTDPKDAANVAAKKARGVQKYNVYEFSYLGERWVVGIEEILSASDRYEQPYYIAKKTSQRIGTMHAPHHLREV